MIEQFGLRQRALSAGLHLLVSAVVATAAAALVLGLWYPGMYRLVSGGRDLLLLVTCVDVVLGPLLTFVVVSPTKTSKLIRRDLIAIVALQSAALIYGLNTAYTARPIAIVFEVDRFRIITASDVYLPELSSARPEYRTLPATGPWLLGTRSPLPDERSAAVLLNMQGVDRANRPLFWQPYSESVTEALSRSRPLSALLFRYRDRDGPIRKTMAEMNADEETARFLPLVARGEWVAVLDSHGEIVGVLMADGFF